MSLSEHRYLAGAAVCLWLAVSSPGEAAPICSPEQLAEAQARAQEALDDFFLWEDLDEHEADAELRRFISRTRSLLLASKACNDPEILRMRSRMWAARLRAQEVRNARRRAARAPVRRKPLEP